MKTSPNFNDLTFDRFRELATASELSHHEKVGFPDAYREGKEEAIFRDMLAKLGALGGSGKTVLEIGPGCSALPVMLVDLCAQRGHTVHFVDSQEMLDQLPAAAHVRKWPARYPEVPQLFAELAGKVDVIVAYSVVQYIFAEGNLWDVLDRSLGLLAAGGEMFWGDIPNLAMRKRFFSSAAGIACHQEYTGRQEMPDVQFNRLEPGQMDDSVVLSLLARARGQGYHAWVLPQSPDLPMANRREDLLFRKP